MTGDASPLALRAARRDQRPYIELTIFLVLEEHTMRYVARFLPSMWLGGFGGSSLLETFPMQERGGNCALLRYHSYIS